MENNDVVKDVAVEVAKELSKNVYTDAVQPTAKNIGGALGTLSGFFNHVVLYPLKMLDIVCEQKAIAFARKTEEKYQEVPEQNQVDPQLHIVGPTMDSLKYNIMNDDLAELFSNLLVSNMDNRTQGLCTPAFVKVIEQLSPNDAKVFKVIYEKGKDREALPLCEIKFYEKTKEENVIKKELIPRYFMGINVQGVSAIDFAKSVQNLARLGLIDIDFIKSFTNTSIYGKILEHEDVKEIVTWASVRTRLEFIPKVENKGIVTLNDFSNDFAKVCLR